MAIAFYVLAMISLGPTAVAIATAKDWQKAVAVTIVLLLSAIATKVVTKKN